MILETLCVGPFEVNCYVLASGADGEAIIIDPGYDCAKIKKVLQKHRLEPAFIVNTHGHYDHIGCDDDFGVPVYAHQKELGLLKDAELNLSNFLVSSYSVKSEVRALQEEDKIELGQIQLEVIHTPGHTPGGICLWMHKPADNILFSGDTLFYRGIGRTDFPVADAEALLNSIKEKLFNLPDNTVVYPGHGPSTTIADEKRENPFLT